MQLKIKKGKHRAWPISFGLWICKKKVQRSFCFDTSCRYQLPDDQMADVNKLFGIGYFPSHKKNSARFGWRYNAIDDRIDIFTFTHVNGPFDFKFICSIPFFKWYRFTIEISKGQYYFKVAHSLTAWNVVGEETVPKTKSHIFSYKLGLFFGGNLPAPQTIVLEMIKS